MTEVRERKETITLLVGHEGTLTSTHSLDFAAGANEVIEVSVADDSPLRTIIPADVRFRRITPCLVGLAHALNLGVSLASSDWIVISFGDEDVSGGWLEDIRSVVSEPDSSCIQIFHCKAGGLPLVAIRRSSFVYGPFDEHFACSRLTVLHWVFRIFPQRAQRILPNEGVEQQTAEFLRKGASPCVEQPLIGLVELWNELDPRLRGELLDQAIATPDTTLQSLQLLSDAAREMVAAVDPYRSGDVYEAKRFWEVNSTGYIRWEIYQPDEPEIIALMRKVTPSAVLELGCGAGRNSRYFSAAQRYAGIDISMPLLRRAVERQGGNVLGMLQGDITALPFADAAFDLVFSDSTVQHVTPERIEQCVIDIVRVSSEYICLIEYTEEENENGEWFKQIHMFAHDYPRLFAPYCDLVWRTDTELRVHPARKEVFLFRKR